MLLISDSLVPASPTDEYYDLGAYSRSISAANEAAKVWFNRGLIWSYSFNHAEAYRCFEQAIVHDPICAMAYWGLAYAAGPNYNKAWRMFDPVDLERSMKICHDAARYALSLCHTSPTTPVERALIEAMQARFPVDHPVEDFSLLDQAYAQAMKRVYDQFGSDDLDVVTLYVDARMHTSQRKMFHLKTGLPIESSPVEEVKQLFKIGLQHPGGEEHPGLIHFSVHFWEMSATPAVALPAADLLRHLVPDAGHIHHMPTHLDVLVGDYRRSVDSNTAAVLADEKYLAREGAKNMYSFYRLHNYHSLVYAAMLSGQSKVALRAIDRMELSITDDVLQVQSPPLADWLEFFKSVRIHVYIRFGLWEELKALPIPHDQDLYCVTTAMTHYGKGIAWAATENITKAEKERELYQAAAKRVPPTRKDYPNLVIDILKVSTAMLDGEIEYRKKNFTSAFERLREAIHHDDSLMYTEPWGWMLPTRHAYAALSLEQGLVEQALTAYAEDLGLDGSLTRAHQHPNNVWALHGYHECLMRLGREPEARIIKQQLDIAMAVADIDIKSSCFCRLRVVQDQNGDMSACCS
ncbi:hypothetical protein L228DRAFT_282583 [Xylona heveae TC161]|uniref:TPR domain protein n=1 Tax=Xylona heveae (strain CBS 132557 / TC161) TaxID=1328760 RepID=A0A165HTC8_XYLHT|nr:hypothetical protein L228DRAFT_282583 [Xylona heveae TC161]KZF23911.1 hypothetical protein L228DRAFT_282583 [Xylona heveae TC161]